MENNPNEPRDLNQSQSTKSGKIGWLLLVVIAVCIVAAYFMFKGGNTTTTDANTNNTKTPETFVPNVQAQNQNSVTTTPPDQTQQQQQDNNAAGQNQNTENTNATGLTLAMGSNFIFANGDNGFNFCIRKENLTETMSGDYGVLIDGTHYFSGQMINKYRPNPQATKVRFLGKITANEKGIWVPKDMTQQGDYYCYKGAPVAFDENGNDLFCLEYCDANGKTMRRFLPHEAVKTGTPCNKTVM